MCSCEIGLAGSEFGAGETGGILQRCTCAEAVYENGEEVQWCRGSRI